MKWENTETPRILVVDDNSRIHADFDLVFSRRQRNPELEADQNEIYGQSEPPAVSKPIYELQHAFSGREGIQKTQSSVADGRPYQVAFVDIRMPGMDGVETTERIWAIDPRIQVVICTAFADYRWEDLADRLGQSDKLLVLKKPFDHIEAFQLACTLSEKWFLTRHAALKFEQMELLVAQRTQRVLDLQRGETQHTHALEQMKLRLLTHLAEEFRGFLPHIHDGLERRRGPEQAGCEAAPVDGSAQGLLRLVEECLGVCQQDEDDLRLRTSEADLVPFLQGVVGSLKPVATQKKVQLEFLSKLTSWPARFDAGKLEKVLVNLLTHSLETIPENGRITVQAQLNPESMQLVMQATGVGRPGKEPPLAAARVGLANPETPKHLPRLRLALAQELMGLQGGSITWESPVHDTEAGTPILGTRCLIHLPLPDVSQAVQPPVEFEPPIAPVGSVPGCTLEEETSLKELPLLLLVLDDADLAVSIQQGFGQDYRTILVKDGTQGLIQAREMLPDVILAEVRLQIMDGIELCRRIKSDELTGHIPIILMTDRKWESGQLQALEAGADDYLLKPFKLSLLKARVDNLRGSRHKLLELFKQVKQLYPRDIATNQSDANFIRRVIHLVEENMSDCDFDLEIMARQLAVSRRQLFRKLRAAAGCSPNIFIRTLRLKRAAQLLTESQMTVTEITYAVGFSDLKYFRNIFREYFGVAPGEYLKRSKTQ